MLFYFNDLENMKARMISAEIDRKQQEEISQIILCVPRQNSNNISIKPRNGSHFQLWEFVENVDEKYMDNIYFYRLGMHRT